MCQIQAPDSTTAIQLLERELGIRVQQKPSRGRDCFYLIELAPLPNHKPFSGVHHNHEIVTPENYHSIFQL